MTAPRTVRTPRRFAVWAGLTMALAVGIVSGAAFLALHDINNSNREVQQAARLLAAYRSMQQVVAREALSEASYRRSPSPASRSALLGALDAGANPLPNVDTLSDPNDVATLKRLLAINAEYASDLRAQLLAQGDQPQILPDDLIAGPALTSMQRVINDALSRLSAHSTQVLEEQRRLTNQLERLIPVVLLSTSALLALAWYLLVRQHRKAQRRAERNLALAHHDQLTGLPNRRAFEAALAAELARPSHDCGLILMDLDGFKEINDSYGHDVGDEVLRIIGAKLAAVVRSSDLVARLGGDEFVLLVHPWAHVEAVQDRLRVVTSEPLQVHNHLLRTSASVGAARVVHGIAQDELLREADRRMYTAKASAKTRASRLRGLPFSG